MVTNADRSSFGSLGRRLAKAVPKIAVVAGVAGAFAAQPAQAVSLWSGTGPGVGGTLSANGLNITVTSCSLKLAGATQSSCAGSGGAAQFEITDVSNSSGGAQILVTGAGGSDIFSNAAWWSGTYELIYALSIAPVGPNTTVSSASMTLGGTGNSSAVSGTETITRGGGNTTTLSTSLTNPTASATFGSVSSFNISNDLKIDAYQFTSLTLSSVRQIFNPAPEPATIGLLLVGIGGIGVAKRRRAQRAAMARAI